MAIRRIKTIARCRSITHPGKGVSPGHRPVKWAHLTELDRRTRIDSDAWFERHEHWQRRKLSVWRALHAMRKHSTIRREARRRGFSLSSSMQLRTLIALARKWSA